MTAKAPAVAILLGAMYISACASVASHSDATVSPRLVELEGRLPRLLDSAGIPGFAATLLQNGTAASHLAVGAREAGKPERVTRNTVFEAASLSKPVVAFMTLKLVDQGTLSLDEPLSRYLPLVDLNDPRASAITARMVLSHTTGLQNERIDNDTLALAFKPGSAFRYSGEAYTYVGHVLEKITGQSLDVIARSLVFDPLGMNRSSFVWEDRLADDAATGHGSYGQTLAPSRPEIARGAATLHTTADDYARFMSAVIRGEGLTDSSRRMLITPTITVTEGIRWTAGWSHETSQHDSALWHHGDNSRSGFTAFAWVNPKTGTGIVYLANSTTGLSVLREILGSISPGIHPAADWINHERFDAPARITRMTIYRRALSEGGAAAISLYRDLKQRGAADAFGEGLLNGLGYRFLSLDRPADAILFFNENARVFPASANVFDSLGDGFAALKMSAEAIEAYRESVRLDPGNDHARDMIRQLEAERNKAKTAGV